MKQEKEVKALQKEFKPIKPVNDNMKNSRFVNAYAYDPNVGRNVAHVVFDTGKAVSLVTGHQFRVSNRELKKIMEHVPKK